MSDDRERLLEPEEISDLATELLRKFRNDAEPSPYEQMTPEQRQQHNEREQRERERRQHASLVKSALERLPGRLREAVLVTSHESTPAVQAAFNWLGTKKRLLMLRGGVGVGKTFAAALAAKSLAEATTKTGVGISWHRPNDFVSAVLHTYDAESPKLGRTLVIVDDVGRETKADLCEALCAFLDDYTARVIITTNLKKADFRERYDARLVDRLREYGEAFDIKGESRRGTNEDF